MQDPDQDVPASAADTAGLAPPARRARGKAKKRAAHPPAAHAASSSQAERAASVPEPAAANPANDDLHTAMPDDTSTLPDPEPAEDAPAEFLEGGSSDPIRPSLSANTGIINTNGTPPETHTDSAQPG